MAEKPSDSPEKPAPEPDKTEGAKPIALTPRQSATPGDRPSPPVAGAVDSAAISEHLMSALAQVFTAQGAPAAAAAREDRGLIAREDKRFRRAGGRGDAPAEKPEGSTGEAPTAPPIAGVGEDPAPTEPVDRRPRTGRVDQATLRPTAPTLRAAWREQPRWQQTALLVLLGSALAMVGFMLGRVTGPAPRPVARDEVAPKGASVQMAEPADIALIDQAMIAQTNGDFSRAENLLRQVLQTAPGLNGTHTALALLNQQKGDLAGALLSVKAGLDAGEDAGRLYGIRGVIQAQLNQPRRAIESFEQGVRAAPHQFKTYFLLAEMFRRSGKNQQALARFDQALARVHEQADEDAMQFKRRLTLVALGRGDELQTEIKQQLAQNPPAGDWLLLAMAVEAQKGDFKAAAVHLERASKLMGADWMVDRLRDFFLYQWCYEKELEPFFRPLQKRLSAARRTEPPPGAEQDRDDGTAPAAAPAARNSPKP